MATDPPICPYCGAAGKLVQGDTVYPHRQDLREKNFWLCRPCDAFVACHLPNFRYARKGDEPLGTMADRPLRQSRMLAHNAFDPIWVTKEMKRKAAYRWLAGKLGINPHDCHIGQFDEQQCKKVVFLCRAKRGVKF